MNFPTSNPCDTENVLKLKCHGKINLFTDCNVLELIRCIPLSLHHWYFDMLRFHTLISIECCWMLHTRSISFLWQVVTPYRPLLVAIVVCRLFSAKPLSEPILGHMPHNLIWLSEQRWRICIGCHNKVWYQVWREINGMICLNKLNETLNDGQVANNLTSISAKHIKLVSVAINGDKMSVSNLSFATSIARI